MVALLFLYIIVHLGLFITSIGHAITEDLREQRENALLFALYTMVNTAVSVSILIANLPD